MAIEFCFQEMLIFCLLGIAPNDIGDVPRSLWTGFVSRASWFESDFKTRLRVIDI
jgi:hypothetical protein